MALAEARRKARAQLHETLALPFRRYRGSTSEYTTVTARLIKRVEPVGDVSGGGVGLAQFRDLQPRLVFLRSENEPVAWDVYILAEDGVPSEDGVYQVENLEPPDGLTITAWCVLLGRNKVSAYFPE